MSKLDSILAVESPTGFINDLADHVFNLEDGLMPYPIIAAGPLLVRAINQLRAFDLTVSNSGIAAWIAELWDKHSGITEVFDRIGAKRANEYLNAAVKLYPGGQVPESMGDRLDFEEAIDEQFVRLDREFKGASVDALIRFRSFIKANRKEFEAALVSFRKVS